MNGKEILVDTNILLYLLEGSDTLVEILQGQDIYVSFITELELTGYKYNSDILKKQIADLLNDCSIISMNNLIKEKYIEIRKRYNIKLADSIIAATSIAYNMPIITADKHFRVIDHLRIITYQHTTGLEGNK